MAKLNHIAKKLRALRKERQLSIQTLARDVEMSRQALYDLEAGVSSPTWETVEKLARYFGCSTEDFRDNPEKVVHSS